MAYQAMTSIYWQRTWFDTSVLQGGIYPMSF